MMLFAVLFSLLFVVGIGLMLLPPGDTPVVSIDTGDARALAVRLTGAFVVGVLVLVVSGWVLPAVVVGVGAVWVIAGWQKRDKSGNVEIARLDALASWIENVRDVLMAGEQPIGAITSTVGACPPVIRPHIRRLAAGLSRQDPEIVFRRFADDLDDPLADLVAAGLAIAIRRGARTVPVLTALAEQTRQQVDRRRLIEAERAPTRREVQALTLIMGTLVVLLLVFGRSQYLDAYDTSGGQLFLAVMLGGYVALILRVQRLAAFPRPSRFLTAGSVGGSPS
ncbi:type II secretion system F family protein [Ilumatobacter sp.]|uniref:type II secretion system F family protein n=1 Tax=Ilumatobacter sp. TaxID=1967498 RepID=UPI003AF74CDC